MGREENWVQANFRALRCFKTWNLVGCFGVLVWFWFFIGGGVLDFGGVLSPLLCLVSDCFEITFLFNSYSRKSRAKKTLDSLLFTVIGGVTN